MIEPGPQASPDIEQRTSEASAAAIQDLARQIEALRTELTARDSAGSRQAAPGSDSECARLYNELKAMEARLQASLQAPTSASPVAARASDRVYAPGKTSLSEIDTLADISMASLERVSADWQEAHLLWTIPQVVERYGPPTNMFAGETRFTLQYLRPRGGDLNMIVEFIAHQGFVTQVIVNR
jgi:hypothetical protein